LADNLNINKQESDKQVDHNDIDFEDDEENNGA
jgi:hypothetical protein